MKRREGGFQGRSNRDDKNKKKRLRGREGEREEGEGQKKFPRLEVETVEENDPYRALVQDLQASKASSSNAAVQRLEEAKAARIASLRAAKAAAKAEDKKKKQMLAKSKIDARSDSLAAAADSEITSHPGLVNDSRGRKNGMSKNSIGEDVANGEDDDYLDDSVDISERLRRAALLAMDRVMDGEEKREKTVMEGLDAALEKSRAEEDRREAAITEDDLEEEEKGVRETAAEDAGNANFDRWCAVRDVEKRCGRPEDLEEGVDYPRATEDDYDEVDNEDGNNAEDGGLEGIRRSKIMRKRQKKKSDVIAKKRDEAYFRKVDGEYHKGDNSWTDDVLGFVRVSYDSLCDSTSDNTWKRVPAADSGHDCYALGLKPRLAARISELETEGTVVRGPCEERLLPLLHSYTNVLLVRPQNLQEQRAAARTYLMHIADHVLRSRDRELRHTARINTHGCSGEAPRDQGFTRPRVLVLLPTRASCWDAVNIFTELLPTSLRSHVESAAKFRLQYYEDAAPPQLRIPRPQDFNDTFRGNTDDCFALGVALSRSSVRLFSSYSKSDIIFASPLGLHLLVNSSGSNSSDFLSSIEILVVDRADDLLMQNWALTRASVGLLNHIPQQAGDTDFSRVRLWALDGFAGLYRQNIIISRVLTPEISALFSRSCPSILPKIRIVALPRPALSRTIPKPGVVLRHVFQRVPAASSPAEAADERFTYFRETVLPHLAAAVQQQVLVYVPSYFDYIRLRNLFVDEGLSCGFVCEHSPPSDQGKARGRFADGQLDFLLVTERFYYYHRYHLRGAHSLVFYAPPTQAAYYAEIAAMLEGPGDTTVLTLFDKYDVLALERVVGSKRAQMLVSSTKNTHLFC